MSDNGFLNSFDLRSSDQSRAERKVSLLAIVETIVSVTVCWWIAQQTGLFILIISSAFVSFFVLLRSDQSIKMGCEMLNVFA